VPDRCLAANTTSVGPGGGLVGVAAWNQPHKKEAADWDRGAMHMQQVRPGRTFVHRHVNGANPSGLLGIKLLYAWVLFRYRRRKQAAGSGRGWRLMAACWRRTAGAELKDWPVQRQTRLKSRLGMWAWHRPWEIHSSQQELSLLQPAISPPSFQKQQPVRHRQAHSFASGPCLARAGAGYPESRIPGRVAVRLHNESRRYFSSCYY
jgi:hypothetical protein